MNAQPQNTFEIQAGARVTPSPASSSASARNRDKFYELAELLAEIESSFIVNTVFKRKAESMWAALKNTHELNLWIYKDHSDPSTYKYSVPHIFAAACHNMGIAQDADKSIFFSSLNGRIKAERSTFEFIPQVVGAKADPQSGAAPSVRKITLEDAFNVLILASFSNHAPSKLDLEGGSEEERAIYYQAIKAFNNSAPPIMRFRLGAELEKLVQDAPDADQELARYMGRVKLDESTPGVNHENIPESPTIIPDTEAKPQSAQAEETAAPEKSPSESESTQTSPAPATAIPTVAFGQATMNGEALQAEDYQKLVDRCSFDPQLTLAKTFIGSRVYSAYPDEPLPMDLLAIYETAAGKHWASVRLFDQTKPFTLPLDELTLPKRPEIKSVSGSLTSYKFGPNP